VAGGGHRKNGAVVTGWWKSLRDCGTPVFWGESRLCTFNFTVPPAELDLCNDASRQANTERISQQVYEQECSKEHSEGAIHNNDNVLRAE